MKPMFCVYDSLANRWHDPYPVDSEPLAIRAFIGSCRSKESPLNTSPQDFTLFEVGHFDPEEGTITPNTSNRRVMTALEALHVLRNAAVEDERQLKLAGGEN